MDNEREPWRTPGRSQWSGRSRHSARRATAHAPPLDRVRENDALPRRTRDRTRGATAAFLSALAACQKPQSSSKNRSRAASARKRRTPRPHSGPHSRRDCASSPHSRLAKNRSREFECGNLCAHSSGSAEPSAAAWVGWPAWVGRQDLPMLKCGLRKPFLRAPLRADGWAARAYLALRRFRASRPRPMLFASALLHVHSVHAAEVGSGLRLGHRLYQPSEHPRGPCDQPAQRYPPRPPFFSM